MCHRCGNVPQMPQHCAIGLKTMVSFITEFVKLHTLIFTITNRNTIWIGIKSHGLSCQPNVYVSWSTSELRVRLAPWNRFKRSSNIFYWPFQGGISFVEHLCYVWLVFIMLCYLLVTCWERADLLAILALVCVFTCVLSFSHVVSWVRCATWLYRFLIFATFLTLVPTKILSISKYFAISIYLF